MCRLAIRRSPIRFPPRTGGRGMVCDVLLSLLDRAATELAGSSWRWAGLRCWAALCGSGHGSVSSGSRRAENPVCALACCVIQCHCCVVRESSAAVSHRVASLLRGALAPIRNPSLPARQVDPGGPLLGLGQASPSVSEGLYRTFLSNHPESLLMQKGSA